MSLNGILKLKGVISILLLKEARRMFWRHSAIIKRTKSNRTNEQIYINGKRITSFLSDNIIFNRFYCNLFLFYTSFFLILFNPFRSEFLPYEKQGSHTKRFFCILIIIIVVVFFEAQELGNSCHENLFKIFCSSITRFFLRRWNLIK